MVAHNTPLLHIGMLSQALDTAPWPALLVDAETDIHAANRAAYQLLHAVPPVLLADQLSAFIAPACADELRAVLQAPALHGNALVLSTVAASDIRTLDCVVLPLAHMEAPLAIIALLQPALPTALAQALGAAIARCFALKSVEALRDTLGHALAPFGLQVELAVDGRVEAGWSVASGCGLSCPQLVGTPDILQPPCLQHGAAPQAPELLWANEALTLPLLADGEAVGQLYVGGPGLQLGLAAQLQPFIGLLGIAVKHVRQTSEPQLDQARTALLLQASQAISEVTDLDRVLRVVCQQALAVSGGVTAALLKPEPDGTHLRCVMAVGVSSDLLLGQRRAVTGTALGHAFREQRDTVVDDTATCPSSELPLFRSALYTVLQTQGRASGILAVWHTAPRFFGPRETRTVTQYAVNAAIALENAELHEAMRRSEERYRTLFQNALEVVVTLDREGRIVSWNRAALQFLGVSPAELRGGVVNIRDLIVPEKAQLMAELQTRALEGHAVVPTEIEIRRPSGPPAILELTVQLLQERDQPQGLSIIGRDITERRQLEAQLRQGEKLAALGQLVAGAAHELNNPLAVVLGTTQLLLRDPLAASFGEDVRNIEAAAQRAKHIVKQMLTFARQHEEARAAVPLRPLLDRVLGSMQPLLCERQVTVTLRVAADLPPVWGDAYQLEQVLDNLLHNAVHALAEQETARRIEISATTAGKRLQLRVVDNGPGMAPAVLSRIFDPFFTTKQVGSGTGLGLSLVHGIVNKHGGAIRAESTAGQGATFVVDLPLSAEPVAQPQAPASSAPNDKAILVVEDEIDVRLILERALRQYGYTVDAVESAEAALVAVDARRYDLVITDMRMPGMSGRELFERVRVAQPQLGWVFVTGDTMSVTSEAFLKQTGVPFLPKPFSLEELWEAVALGTQPRPE